MRLTLAISILPITIGGLIAASAETLNPTSDGGPPLTDDQLRAAILQDYRKDEATRFLNDFNFLRSYHATRAMVDKYLGVKNPTPSIPTTNPCLLDPHLFVRHDRLDTFQLDQAVDVGNAKGASISGTQDERAGTKTLTVNGRLEYLLFGRDAACDIGERSNKSGRFDTPLFGYAVAPFIDAQGTIDIPAKKTDTNNLQAGVDIQTSVLGGPFFTEQFMIVTPYYQTDFKGVAQVGGITVGWEPVNPTIHLGGSFAPGPYLDWFWQVRAEFDEKHVGTKGSTGLTKGNYDWFGGTIQVHFDLFPGQTKINPFYVSPVPWLEDRFYSNLTLKTFWNANDNRSATWFEAELGYNLTTDKKSSVSLKYDLGTDKDTLITSKKYLLAINFKN